MEEIEILDQDKVEIFKAYTKKHNIDYVGGYEEYDDTFNKAIEELRESDKLWKYVKEYRKKRAEYKAKLEYAKMMVSEMKIAYNKSSSDYSSAAYLDRDNNLVTVVAKTSDLLETEIAKSVLTKILKVKEIKDWN